MAQTPAQSSVTLSENNPFLDINNARVEHVTIDASAVDSANTPTTQLRRGLVLGYDSSEGNWLDSADALVDAHSSGSHTSAEAPDGDWEAETIAVTVVGEGTITHTHGANTTVTNQATAIADWNAGPVASLAIMAASGGNIVITAVKPGVRLSITPSLATAFAGGAAEATSDGALTPYGILRDPIPSMLGIDDTAEDKNAHIYTANCVVREADLLGATTAARQYFAANGILLD